MRFHVIFGHPLGDSFNAAVRDRAVAALERAGHEVDLFNLYDDGFQPCLTPEERRLYHDLDRNQEPVRAEIDRLMAAEGLLLVFPIWSFGLPAIVKGWFDRVMVPGVAFNIVNGRVRGNLRHVRVFGAIMTYGQPWWVVHYLGNPVRRVMMKGYARNMAFDVKKLWLPQYDMNRATEPQLKRFLDRVDRAVGAL